MRRDVELRVVGEHAHGVAGPSSGVTLAQVPVGPVDDHLVGAGEPPTGGEHRPGVADRHPVAEDLGHGGQGGGEVDGPEDDHAGRGANASMNTVDRVLADLPVQSVVTGEL